MSEDEKNTNVTLQKILPFRTEVEGSEVLIRYDKNIHNKRLVVPNNLRSHKSMN